MKSYIPANRLKLIKRLEGFCKADIYIVGGYVRNKILKEPSNDKDLVIDLPLEDITKRLKKAPLAFFPTSRMFGGGKIIMSGEEIDVSSLYRVSKDDFGLDSLEYTPIQEDYLSRDFTMNTLYVNSKGKLFDPCNGLKDLKAGLVRFVHDPLESIQYDPKRILRFIRFYAEYDKNEKSLTPEIMDLLNNHSHLLYRASPEMITQIFIKICKLKNRTRAFRLINRIPDLQEIFQLDMEKVNQLDKMNLKNLSEYGIFALLYQDKFHFLEDDAIFPIPKKARHIFALFDKNRHEDYNFLQKKKNKLSDEAINFIEFHCNAINSTQKDKSTKASKAELSDIEIINQTIDADNFEEQANDLINSEQAAKIRNSKSFGKKFEKELRRNLISKLQMLENYKLTIQDIYEEAANNEIFRAGFITDILPSHVFEYNYDLFEDKYFTKAFGFVKCDKEFLDKVKLINSPFNKLYFLLGNNLDKLLTQYKMIRPKAEIFEYLQTKANYTLAEAVLLWRSSKLSNTVYKFILSQAYIKNEINHEDFIILNDIRMQDFDQALADSKLSEDLTKEIFNLPGSKFLKGKVSHNLEDLIKNYSLLDINADDAFIKPQEVNIKLIEKHILPRYNKHPNLYSLLKDVLIADSSAFKTSKVWDYLEVKDPMLIAMLKISHNMKALLYIRLYVKKEISSQKLNTILDTLEESLRLNGDLK
tara:strand:+ start:603 stop:2705 length:2103 start_codon:yes stop_codon:yes gene_type:complete